MKKGFYLCITMLTLLILFLLSACGRNTNQPTRENTVRDMSTESNANATEPTEYVLTAVVPTRFAGAFNRAAMQVRTQKREEGNTFRLDMTQFPERE
ncbi:MAG: hypothetical protein FWG38_01745 [Defluviitaleaceae bacterium]|nr:hypothetical protein [Defluviitaleaceae bacterium]